MNHLVLVVMLAAAACNMPDRGPRFRPAGHGTPRDGGTLRFASKDQVRTLDPAIAADDISTLPEHLLFDTLVDYEPSTRDAPGSGLGVTARLAETWDISPDGRRYRFTLRAGLAYSDGTPVVAADVKYSLERALTMPDSPYGHRHRRQHGPRHAHSGQHRASQLPARADAPAGQLGSPQRSSAVLTFSCATNEAGAPST